MTEEEDDEEEKGLQTHLVPKEMETTGTDERERRRAHFCTAPAPPQAHSHCARAVIFQQIHRQSKISYLMAQVVFCFPSTLPFRFLISDTPMRPQRLLSNTRMRGPRISWAGTHQYRQKMCPRVLEGSMPTGDTGLGKSGELVYNPPCMCAYPPASAVLLWVPKGSCA